MSRLLPLIFLFSFFSAHAGLERINAQGLNLNYTLPHGEGDVEKLQAGFSLVEAPYPLVVDRTDAGFQLTSPFVDITIGKATSFVHEMKQAHLEKFNGDIGVKKHFIKAENITFTPEKSGEYQFSQIDLNCEGVSVQEKMLHRVFDDCQKNMQAKMKKMVLPVDFFLLDILSQLPDAPEDEEMPAEDFTLSIKEGDFQLGVRVVKAGLKAKGHIQYENEYQTVAIRIDQVKYGIMSVTSLVMKLMKERIKNPQVTITPPWIRIKLHKP